MILRGIAEGRENRCQTVFLVGLTKFDVQADASFLIYGVLTAMKFSKVFTVAVLGVVGLLSAGAGEADAQSVYGRSFNYNRGNFNGGGYGRHYGGGWGYNGGYGRSGVSIGIGNYGYGPSFGYSSGYAPGFGYGGYRPYGGYYGGGYYGAPVVVSPGYGYYGGYAPSSGIYIGF